MSTVYLDPEQMDATGGAVGEHAKEVEALATEVDALASTPVPPSLAAWFADELREIALAARLGALLYLVATVDALQRSEQIRANQSLAAAVTAPAGATATFTGPAWSDGFVLGSVQPVPDPFVGPFTAPLVGGGFVLGDVGTSGYTPIDVTVGFSQETFLANNPLVRIGSGQALGVHELVNDSLNASIERTVGSRPGVTALGNGSFSGQGRIGDQIYRNPKVPGEYLVG